MSWHDKHGTWEHGAEDLTSTPARVPGRDTSVTIDNVQQYVPSGSGSSDTAQLRVLRLTDREYPAGFRVLSHPPRVVFIAGSLSQRDQTAVAVVGSRRAAAIAEQQAFSIGRSLAEAGITVVSGLALGIDSAAHRGALSVPDGRTIAVVATGLDTTFPSENAGLDEQIRRRGAVISVFATGTGPSRSNFLGRNELVAALAQASVIVVADERSGTSSEIGHTLAQGKPVVFWEPNMSRAAWACALVGSGRAYFACDFDGLMAGIRGGRGPGSG